MADVNADIIINVDTSVGISEIKNLQRIIAQLNAQLIQSGARQAQAAKNVQRNLIDNINATGKFSANVKTISTSAESFTTALERNKLSIGQYFKYAGASTKTFGRVFRSEFDTIEKVATERVKTLQTQYIKLGRDANGAMKAIAVRPLALDMENLSTKTAMAAQKQQLLNQLLKQGSTNLLNFGKNTQWAGRQLMMGFTLPLITLGTIASKTFMEMETQALKFKRVYGELFTTQQETDEMVSAIQLLSKEFTKYGVEAARTMETAADAAAMGKMGVDLLAQVTQSTRLSVLGNVEASQALETTVSVTNAFGVAAEKLAGKIDFLNAVENQTVTSIEDLTIAIPKAGPVVKQLGGDVEDLAFFLTAMKEGGINASEGANALKSGLAALINPTGKASEFMLQFGINISKIVEANKGDVKGLVIDFAQALDTLDPLNRARSIEQLFGKFQFSRLSTLFQNVIVEGSQAERVLKLTAATSEELAILSERELKRVEDSPMFKFQKAFQDIKVSLVPLGEAFLKAITPVLKFATEFLEKFNSMGEGARNFAVVATTVVAGIGPVLLMTFGLIANGVANLIKMFSAIGGLFSRTGKSSTDLAQSTDYMTQQQLEAAAVAGSLNQSHAKLIQTFTVEAGAVNTLAASYGKAIIAQERLLGASAGGMVARGGKAAPKAPKPKKYKSGVLSVPGPRGAGDIVPAMLAPGESVIPAKQSEKYSGLIQGMINDDIPGYRFGRMGAIAKKAKASVNPFSMLLGSSRVSTRVPNATVQGMLKSKDFQYRSAFETKTGRDFTKFGGKAPNSYGQSQRTDMERDMMGIQRDAPASQRPTYGSVERTAFGSILSRLLGLRGKQFRDITSPGNKSLDLYGSVDLVGKRKLNKKARVFAGDALKQYGYSDMHYKMRRGRGEEGNFLPPMSGASKADLEKAGRFYQLNHPFGKGIPNGPGFTSNPGSPYIEAHLPGGFNLKDVAKIRVPSRAEAKELQKLVDKAGLGIRVTPQNAPAMVKIISGLIGSRFSNGVLAFDGKDYPVATPEGATNLAKTIKMLTEEKGIAPKDITRRLEHYVQKSIDTKRAHVNAKNIAQSFNFKPDGSPLERGAGKSGSPEKLRLMGQPAQSEFKDEREYLKGIIASRGLDLTPGALINALQLQASHIHPGKDVDGKKIWTDFKNLVPDLGYINGYLNDISAPNSRFMNALAEELANDPKAAKKYGIDIDNFNKIRAGIHPTTKSEIQTLKAIADRNVAFDPKAKNIYRAIMSSAGIDFRLQNGYYNNPVKTYEDRVKSGQFKTRQSRKLTPAVPKEESVSKPAKVEVKTNQIKPQSEANRISDIQNRYPAAPTKSRTAGRFGRSIKYYNSGVLSVPGPKGAGDIVPAMLTPGEAVIPAEESKKYAPLISAMISDSVPGYNKGKKGYNFSGPTPITPIPTPPPSETARQAAASFMPPAEAKKSGNIFGRAAFSVKTVAEGAKNLGSGVAATLSQKAGSLGRMMSMDDEVRNAETAKVNARMNAKANIREAKFLEKVGRFSQTKVGGAIDRVGSNSAGMERMFGFMQGKHKDQSIFGGGVEQKTDKAGRTYFTQQGVGRISREAAEANRVPRSEQKAERRQRFAQGTQKLGMVGMGMSMAASAAMMLPGDAGKVAGEIAPIMIGLSSLAMLVQGPVTAALAALAVAVGAPIFAMFKANEAFNAAQDKAMALANSLSVGDTAINKLAKFAGNATAGEIMDRRRSETLSPFQIKTGKTTFGQSFVQGEEGKALISNVQESINTDGREQAAASLRSQMATAVASGALDAAQARSVVANLAEQLGDTAFGIQVNGQLMSLLGPNGEKLEKDPIKVRVQMLQESQSRAKLATESANKIAGDDFMGLSDNAIATGLGGAAAGAGLGAATGAAIGAAFAPVTAGLSVAVGAVLGTAIGAISGGITGLIAGNVEHQNNIAEASGANVALQQMALEQQQQISDSLELEYEQRIAAAEAAGDLVEKERLLGELQRGRVAVLEQNKVLNDQIMSSFNTAQDQELKTALMSGADKAIASKYAEGPMADVAKLATSRISDSGLAEEQQYLLKLQVASGEIDPVQMLNILSMPKETQTRVINIVGKYGGAFMNQASAVTSLFVDKDGKPIERLQTEFLAKVDAAKTSEEASRILEFYQKVSQSGVVLDTALTVDMLLKNPKKAAELEKVFDKLSDLKGPITVDVLSKVVGAAELAAINEDLDYFTKLPDAEKKIYTQVLATTLATVSPDDPQLQGWLSAEGAAYKNSPPGTQLREYAQWNARTVSEIAVDKTTAGPATPPKTTPGGGTKPEDPYEDLLKKLKEVRDASIKATGGITELNRVLGGSKNMKQFKGVEQQLMSKNAGSGFIDFVLGLDQNVQKKFITIKKGLVSITAAGKAMAKGFNEASLGDFQISLLQAGREAMNQSIAFTKLKNAGMSTASALAAVEDPATAAAVASKSISSAELVALGKAANVAERQVARAAAKLQLINDIQSGKGQAEMFDRFSGNNPNLTTKFTEAQQFAIENDATLSKIYQDFLSGALTSFPAEFGERLQQVINNIQFKESLFQDGFGKAMDQFAAKEESFRVAMEVDLESFDLPEVVDDKFGAGARKIVSNAQNEIAGLSNEIDNYQAGLREIEYQEQAINDKYEKKFEALDKVEKANARISNQQKGQLSVADALTRGDIAAAARAVQESRAQSSQDAISSQREALSLAETKELEALKSTSGLTRKQLDEKILVLEKQIFQIEESRLEPANERIRLAQVELDKNIDQITVLGRTRLQWEGIKAGIDLAKTSSDAYTSAIQAALDVVDDILAYWKDLDGKVIKTTHEITTVNKDGNTPKVEEPKVEEPKGDGAGSGSGNGTDPVITDTRPQSVIDAENSLKAFEESGQNVAGFINKLDSEAAAKATAAKAEAAAASLETAKAVGVVSNVATSVNTTTLAGILAASNPTVRLNTSADAAERKIVAAKAAADKAAADKAAAGRATADTAERRIIASISTTPTPTTAKAVATTLGLGAKSGTGIPAALARPTTASILQSRNLKLSSGGMVKRFAAGGFAMGTDTIPAVLSPGEFVVRKYAVDNFGVDNLKAVNNGSYSGESVYNYSVNVNVKSDANPDQIAKAVMGQIKQIDSQRIRGNRF